ncbi:MAG: DUF2782 domain-containing protein [Zoogloeaceae bacterium]|jgi:hypothetical protein|nr:DUF2782 domain-containing protein [Zoogloeaceae bacterium]
MTRVFSRLAPMMVPMVALLGALMLVAPQAHAQEKDRIDEQLPAVPPPPPEIQALEEGNDVVSEVVIRETERGTETEYRINGRLYKVKVTPTVGAPYYLLDKDGDGTMESHSLDDPGLSVPMWVIGTF